MLNNGCLSTGRQDLSKRDQESPRAAQDPLKTAQKPAKTRQIGPKSTQEPPKTSPRAPKSGPRPPQDGPRPPQEPSWDGLGAILGPTNRKIENQTAPGQWSARSWVDFGAPNASQNDSKTTLKRVQNQDGKCIAFLSLLDPSWTGLEAILDPSWGQNRALALGGARFFEKVDVHETYVKPVRNCKKCPQDGPKIASRPVQDGSKSDKKVMHFSS